MKSEEETSYIEFSEIFNPNERYISKGINHNIMFKFFDNFQRQEG
jgi:hypothetical protein